MSIQKIKSETQFKEILAAGACIIDYFAEWCGPCKQIAPHLPVIAEQYPLIKFYKVDIDELEEVAQDQKITSMPTFKIYVNGSVVKTIVGASLDKIRLGLDETYEVQGWSKDAAPAPAAAAVPSAAAAPTTGATASTTTDAAAPAAAAPTDPNAGKVIQLQSETEYKSITQKKYCVIDYFAEWCGPCKQLAPFFKTLAAEYPHVSCAKIDFDDFTDLCEDDGVASLPTLIFFKEGKKVQTHVGTNKDKITAAFKEHFGQ